MIQMKIIGFLFLWSTRKVMRKCGWMFFQFCILYIGCGHIHPTNFYYSHLIISSSIMIFPKKIKFRNSHDVQSCYVPNVFLNIYNIQYYILNTIFNTISRKNKGTIVSRGRWWCSQLCFSSSHPWSSSCNACLLVLWAFIHLILCIKGSECRKYYSITTKQAGTMFLFMVSYNGILLTYSMSLNTCSIIYDSFMHFRQCLKILYSLFLTS